MVRAHKTHTTIRRRGFFKDEGNEVKQEGEKEKGRRGSVDSSQRQYIFEGNSRGMYTMYDIVSAQDIISSFGRLLTVAITFP